MIKVWFHLHSEYSSDSCLKLKKILELAEKNNIRAVILTDHNNLFVKNEIGEEGPIKIIIGEEIKTIEGEIIGIFLKQKIEPNLSIEETIKKIKEQNGIVIVPHPFDRFRREVIKKEALFRVIEQTEVVEIFNARNLLNLDNKKAADFAREYNKIPIVGSDAHIASEIKNTHIEMEDFNGPEDFLAKLKNARFYTKKSGAWVHFASTASKILKKL